MSARRSTWGRVLLVIAVAAVVAALPALASAAARRTVSSPAVPLVLHHPDRHQASSVAAVKAPTKEAHREHTTAPRPAGAILVRVPSALAILASPGGRAVATMPSSSLYLHQPLTTWVLRTSRDGRFGEVTLPWSGRPNATGWILLSGLARSTTNLSVHVSLSRHELTVLRGSKVLLRTVVGTGATASPTPTGRFFVTDRVAASGAYGAFAFGLSAIQTHLPAGWGGGNQVAIHGTNDPGSIGRSSSAGCIHVAAGPLRRLIPLLRLGTPVVIAT
jgi:lipoprotein-anchoring transpeptidase ErfK/SrfK